ncbi:hypothetical protein ACE4V3_04955 (plasmid) [Borrelia recurrentis]|nr:hypothetical protein [Borrelia recurrentis]
MVKVRYIVFLFILFSNLNSVVSPSSPLVRPFDFSSWNFERDIEEAYEASYKVVDGILVNVDDPNKNVKSKHILSRISELEGYYKCLVNVIRDNIFLQVEDEFLREYGQYFDDDVFTETDNRFKQLIEIPMEDTFGMYRHRVLTFSNKTWIKNPDYTKLFIKLQLKEIEFVEDYIKQRLGIKLGANGQKVNHQLNDQRYGNNSMENEYDDASQERRGAVVPGYDRGSRPVSRVQRPNYDRESRVQQSVPRQEMPRSVVSRQSSGRPNVSGSKVVKPSSIKRGNLRPSSIRPSLRRPGSDIRPNFVRPIVRPLGEKPVTYKRGSKDSGDE